MLSLYAGQTILGVALGILGGSLAHITFLLKLGRSLAQQGKTPSMGKKSKRLRISLLFLSIGFGGGAGFIVALIGYNNHMGLSALMAASVVCGLVTGALVRFLGAPATDG
jgi:hypothetical protein